LTTDSGQPRSPTLVSLGQVEGPPVYIHIPEVARELCSVLTTDSGQPRSPTLISLGQLEGTPCLYSQSRSRSRIELSLDNRLWTVQEPDSGQSWPTGVYPPVYIPSPEVARELSLGFTTDSGQPRSPTLVSLGQLEGTPCLYSQSRSRLRIVLTLDNRLWTTQEPDSGQSRPTGRNLLSIFPVQKLFENCAQS
jgi:hypothetical protein